ncbi:hypothetical protein BDZ97DRAFT_1764619 [Flammula alnicola]|nr:hypothetical protein BDZ97DRAFT_1764619 [Flammula alnicola]
MNSELQEPLKDSDELEVLESSETEEHELTVEDVNHSVRPPISGLASPSASSTASETQAYPFEFQKMIHDSSEHLEHGSPFATQNCPESWSSLVMGTGNPRANFCRPAPVPAKTRTRGHGCGFARDPWVQKPVRV